MMRLPPVRLLRTTVFSYVPVVISILTMIVVRANDLARENDDAGLWQGFFHPSTPEQAIVSGFIIWILGAFLVASMAVLFYHMLRTRTRFQPYHLIIVTMSLAVVMTAGLFVTGDPFAPEGAFEMMACGVGFGLLVPLFYERERNLAAWDREGRPGLPGQLRPNSKA